MIPIRVDRRLKHTPWVNFALIGANVGVFLATRGQVEALQVAQMYGDSPGEWLEEYPIYNYFLHPDNPRWYQFFTYQFLHADILHLVGNMLFLYIFGSSIEDRFGAVGYGQFYIAGGVVAGIGHAMTSDGAGLGASGAVAATTGAFL